MGDIAPALGLVEGGNGVTKPDALVKSRVNTEAQASRGKSAGPVTTAQNRLSASMPFHSTDTRIPSSVSASRSRWTSRSADDNDSLAPLGALGGNQLLGLGDERSAVELGHPAERGDDRAIEPRGDRRPGCPSRSWCSATGRAVDGGPGGDGLSRAALAGDHPDHLLGDAVGDPGDRLVVAAWVGADRRPAPRSLPNGARSKAKCDSDHLDAHSSSPCRFVSGSSLFSRHGSRVRLSPLRVGVVDAPPAQLGLTGPPTSAR